MFISPSNRTKTSTPFHVVCSNGHSKMAELFVRNSIKYNIDLNAKDSLHGYTGFHFACFEGHVEIVEILVDNAEEFDIDLRVKDFFGRTGLDLAKREWDWMIRRSKVTNNVTFMNKQLYKYKKVVNMLKRKMPNRIKVVIV